MGYPRFALLIRSKENLELKVSCTESQIASILGADQSKDFREGAKVKNDEGIIGRIVFEDEKTPKEILVDFLRIYPSSIVTMDALSGDSSFVTYPLRYESTIASAFVQYFSPPRPQ